MLSAGDLEGILKSINGRGYKAYKDIEGQYRFETFTLYIDHVQADPFAPPSRLRVRVPMEKAGFPQYLFKGERVVALEDYVARTIKKMVTGKRQGTGNSGILWIDAGHQEVLPRAAVKINNSFIEVRLSLGMPAAGRRVLGNEAGNILLRNLPELVKRGLCFCNYSEDKVREHVFLYEDQNYIRDRLEDMELVCFIGDGAILPRRSGDSSLPLQDRQTVSFISPKSLQVSIETLHHGRISGMGIPRGVTLIVGGGFHGKSTLLKAIEAGVYNHIGGDGREWTITINEAVKIRAEDGRKVEKVNITYFIDNLPLGQDTRQFSTANASGSTSQAANIIEAVEVGAKLLLLDEDTSATNFMIRDARMQKLVDDTKEPITPFIDRVRQLYTEYGISTIVIIGGAGDYLDVADRVIMMDAYQPVNVTEKARVIADSIKNGRQPAGNGEKLDINHRVISLRNFSSAPGKRFKVGAKGRDIIAFGPDYIDLSAVEQLVDSSQTRAVAECLRYVMENLVDEKTGLTELIEAVYKMMGNDLDSISPYWIGQHPGDFALPRRFEIAAALNRWRSLVIK